MAVKSPDLFRLAAIGTLCLACFSASAPVQAAWFEMEKSRFKLGASIDDNYETRTFIYRTSADLKWAPGHDDLRPLKFYSRPWFEYESTRVADETEQIRSWGLDVVKVQYEYPLIHPFIAAGAEQQDIYRKSGTEEAWDEDTVANLVIGVDIPIGRLLNDLDYGLIFTCYRKQSYETDRLQRVRNKVTFEFDIDLLKLFQGLSSH